MNEFDLLHAWKDAWPGPQIRASTWIYAMCQTMHFVGLVMLLGSLMIVDLRLMGFFKSIPMKAAMFFVPTAIIGFCICFMSGYVFWAADPFMFWPNPSFRVKLVLIVLAGLNAIVFSLIEHKRVLALPLGQGPDTFTRMSAGLSLVLWTGVLLFGRLIPAFAGSTSLFG